MDRSELVRLYAAFMKSAAGEDLTKELDREISDSHKAAEKDPDHAKDHVLTAKAARQIKEYIARMSIDAKHLR